MNDLTTSTSYFDFGSLTALRGQASTGERKALRKVAEQFESHFIQETLKSMRQTIVKSELSESPSTDLYEDLMDKEVAQQMARRGGIGLADMLERHLSAAQALAVPSTQAALQARALPVNPPTPSLPLDAPVKVPMPVSRAAAGYALPGPAIPGAKP